MPRGFQVARQGRHVLDGAVFAGGRCVIHWHTPAPTGAVAVFDTLDGFLEIHVTAHPEYHTCLVFEDGERRCYGPDRTRHWTTGRG